MILYPFVRDNVIKIVEDPERAVKKHAQGWKLVKVDELLDVWRNRDTAAYARLREDARRERDERERRPAVDAPDVASGPVASIKTLRSKVIP